VTPAPDSRPTLPTGSGPTPPAGPSPAGPPGAAAGGPPWLSPGVALAAIVALVLAGVLAAALHDALTPSPPASALSVVADSVHTVVLHAPPGRLTVTGEPASHLATPGRVTLTGSLHWSGPAAAVAARPRQSGHTLWLSYRCAAGSPCTGTLRLVVPRGITFDLVQPSGRVILAALAGPVRIRARSVNVTASRLRSPDLAAAITSGHLSASFDDPPRRLAVTLLSAQATVWLPARATYQLSQQVTAGYLHAAIPQASAAAQTVTARIDSGELELLPRPAAR
jgi:hypothetical protein